MIEEQIVKCSYRGEDLSISDDLPLTTKYDRYVVNSNGMGFRHTQILRTYEDSPVKNSIAGVFFYQDDYRQMRKNPHLYLPGRANPVVCNANYPSPVGNGLYQGRSCYGCQFSSRQYKEDSIVSADCQMRTRLWFVPEEEDLSISFLDVPQMMAREYLSGYKLDDEGDPMWKYNLYLGYNAEMWGDDDDFYLQQKMTTEIVWRIDHTNSELAAAIDRLVDTAKRCSDDYLSKILLMNVQSQV